MNGNTQPPAPGRRNPRQARVSAEHEREAGVLKKLFESKKRELNLTQASLGQEYEIGNQAAVWQFLNGKVPLSMKAARGFAKGLRCELADFSPRLAREALTIGTSVHELSTSSAITSFGTEDVHTSNKADTFGAGADRHPLYAGKVSLSRQVPITSLARLLDDGCYLEETMGGLDGFVRLQTEDAAAYGLRVRGDQMAPAIRDGWYVVVSPNSKPTVGEYVAIELKTGDKMIRELLYERDDSIAVSEVNGSVRRTIQTSDIAHLHAVSAVVSPSQWIPR